VVSSVQILEPFCTSSVFQILVPVVCQAFPGTELSLDFLFRGPLSHPMTGVHRPLCSFQYQCCRRSNSRDYWQKVGSEEAWHVSRYIVLISLFTWFDY